MRVYLHTCVGFEKLNCIKSSSNVEKVLESNSIISAESSVYSLTDFIRNNCLFMSVDLRSLQSFCLHLDYNPQYYQRNIDRRVHSCIDTKTPKFLV